jgi:hypothetical protein
VSTRLTTLPFVEGCFAARASADAVFREPERKLQIVGSPTVQEPEEAS